MRDRQDGLLVPAGDAVELGEALRDLALDPDRRRRAWPRCARERAERFAWPQVAQRGHRGLRGGARATRSPRAARPASRRAVGAKPAEPGPRMPPRRLPSLEPTDAGARRRAARLRPPRRVRRRRRGGRRRRWPRWRSQRIGIESIGRALVAATPIWVLVGFALMCASMLLRAEAWHAILRAALPGHPRAPPRHRAGTMIGVLMSATLPARLGEPSRALIVARRLGRMRDRFPVVLGTLVSQTLLNLLALAVLGAVMFATVGHLPRRRGRARDRHDRAAWWCSALVLAVAVAAAARQAVALPARAAGGRRGARRDGPGALGPRRSSAGRGSAAGRR